MMQQYAVSINNLNKSYASGESELRVLKGVSVNLPPGKMITLMGPSGSGKSTLMHILSGIDRPDTGTVKIFGQDLGSMNETEITLFRRHTIGIIFQFFNLMPYLTGLENTALPLFLSGMGRKKALGI
ncbi:MAG: ATP-binding cassette domain-containing protein, partial [Leptospira sp.]|nr:ATP-binding cassette domain-containing protein [Leptospira sp.]